MFKSLILSLLAMGIFIFSVIRIQPTDYETYRKIVPESNVEESQSLFSKHQRSNVHKQICLKKDSPLQISIQSTHSELLLTHKHHQITAVEELEGVTCIMQDEVFYHLSDGTKIPFEKASSYPPADLIPMQAVRYMEAEKAVFDYKTQHFFAEGVKLWEYLLPGHQLVTHVTPETPAVMTGTAKSAVIKINGKKFDFQASQMRVSIYNNKEIL